MRTKRLELRRWHDSDASTLFRYASDPNVGPYAGWQPHRSIEESKKVINTLLNNDRTWAIVLTQIGEPIGCICYYTHRFSNIKIGDNDCEIGYWIGKPFWNRGFCTEALKAMLHYCTQVMHFENIWADCFIGSPASHRVLDKCGFIDTGKSNKRSQLVGADKDMVKLFRYDMHQSAT